MNTSRFFNNIAEIEAIDALVNIADIFMNKFNII